MKNPTFLILAALLILKLPLAAGASADKNEMMRGKKIAPPKKIESNGKIFVYSPAHNMDDPYLEANLDQDPENEIVLGFMSVYKTPEKKNEREGTPPFLLPEKDKKPGTIEYRAFYQIYDAGPGGHLALIKTISGMDGMGEIHLLRLEENTPPAIAFINPGGERYKDISIYGWQEGGFRLLLNRGASCGIELKPGPPVEVRVGKCPEGKSGWSVFRWDSTSRNFEEK